MFVIDLRRADGSALPYRLSIEPDIAGFAHLRVLEFPCPVQKGRTRGERTIAWGIAAYNEIPLSETQEETRCGNITMAYEPSGQWLLFEFGDDPRLAMLPAAEVRSAMNVCRWYDRDTAVWRR